MQVVLVSQESQTNREYETASSYCGRTEVIPAWAFYSSTKWPFRTAVDDAIPCAGVRAEMGASNAWATDLADHVEVRPRTLHALPKKPQCVPLDPRIG